MSVVSISLARSGEIVLGVMRHPYLKETFYAKKGRETFLNRKELHVSGHSLLSLAWCCYNKNLTPMCFKTSKRLYFNCEDIRRIGTTTYEICMIAKGAEEMEFKIKPAPWDVPRRCASSRRWANTPRRWTTTLTSGIPAPS